MDKKFVLRKGLLVTVGFFVSLSAHFSVFKTQALSSQTIDTTLENDAEVNAYYAGVDGLTGASLQSGLYHIIKNATSMTYDETAYAMKITDRNWDLSPLSVGTQVLYDLSKYGTDDPYLNLLYGTYNASSGTAYRWSADHATIWNKEHTWAKSHGNFLEEAPAGTDLHHLRASDQANNNGHNNFDFGNVATVTATFPDERGNPSGLLGTSAAFSGDSVYEPRDEDKGDIARMIFYMATRYFVYLSVGSPKLEIIDGLSGSSAVTASATVTGKMGILSDLLAWNEADPVSLFEIRRNNLIDHNFQGNRNPFIDHPEWAEAVYDPLYSGPAASLASGTSTASSLSESNLVSLSADTRFVTTAYAVNETFSANGLIVMGNYSDSTSAEIQNWTTDIADGTPLTTVGTLNVTVSATVDGITQTTTYEIGVYNEIPILQSLSLNTEQAPTTFALGSTFSSAGLLVTGVYNIGNKVIPLTSCSFSTPNLYSLGEQSVTVTYSGITSSYKIVVTNAGALVSEGTPSVAPTYSVTTTSLSEFGSSGSAALTSKNLGGVAWNYNYTWKTGLAFFGTSTTRGSQIGSSTNYVTAFVMESQSAFQKNAYDEITKIVFEGSGASGATITLSVFVDNTQIGSTTTLTVNSSSFNTYEFIPANVISGKIRLVFAQPTTAKALYFHGIQVSTLAVTDGVTPRQQALVFANYVFSLPACTMTDDDVQAMVDEYTSMTLEAKTTFATLTNGSTLAQARYDYIVSLHPDAGATGTGDFIQLSDPRGANAPFWLIFVALPFLMIALGSLAWAVFKKRPQKVS